MTATLATSDGHGQMVPTAARAAVSPNTPTGWRHRCRKRWKGTEACQYAVCSNKWCRWRPAVAAEHPIGGPPRQAGGYSHMGQATETLADRCGANRQYVDGKTGGLVAHRWFDLVASVGDSVASGPQNRSRRGVAHSFSSASDSPIRRSVQSYL